MMSKLKDVLQRAEAWPEEDQAELAEIAEQIESRHRGVYAATAEELSALDDADRGGVASAEDVSAAFQAFRSVADLGS
jgi:hypothetical protein